MRFFTLSFLLCLLQAVDSIPIASELSVNQSSDYPKIRTAAQLQPRRKESYSVVQVDGSSPTYATTVTTTWTILKTITMIQTQATETIVYTGVVTRSGKAQTLAFTTTIPAVPQSNLPELATTSVSQSSATSPHESVKTSHVTFIETSESTSATFTKTASPWIPAVSIVAQASNGSLVLVPETSDISRPETITSTTFSPLSTLPLTTYVPILSTTISEMNLMTSTTSSSTTIPTSIGATTSQSRNASLVTTSLWLSTPVTAPTLSESPTQPVSYSTFAIAYPTLSSSFQDFVHASTSLVTGTSTSSSSTMIIPAINALGATSLPGSIATVTSSMSNISTWIFSSPSLKQTMPIWTNGSTTSTRRQTPRKF